MAKIDIFGELHSTTTDGIIADISQIRGADQLGVKDGDVTTSKIADKAVTKTKLDESLQGAVDKANSALQGISTSQSGSGNAVTDVSASGGTVTVTKGKTFAEQSALEAVQNIANNAMPKSGGAFTGPVEMKYELYFSSGGGITFASEETLSQEELRFPKHSGTIATEEELNETVYTKTQVDDKLSNYYTKSETNSAISTAIDNAITKVLNTPV